MAPQQAPQARQINFFRPRKINAAIRFRRNDVQAYPFAYLRRPAFSRLFGAARLCPVRSDHRPRRRSGEPTPTIGELVVTAQRREENLQSTPVAVSAFSAATLKNEKINGGQDLLLQVPNTNFARTNFGGFNFKIRGIGTDVVGAGVSGAAGVSINENELPVTANHFQDSEFFDVDRVEVVRGPQGTLYGRNATGGAVDIITTQPKSEFGGFATLSYGNYNQLKATGAVNIPLGDTLSVRIAGTRLVQDGFGVNTYLASRVDGRDLGAARVTIAFKPTDRFSAYLMYEHFGEDDNRNRIGKQLCTPDAGPASVGGVSTAGGYNAFLSQGCLPASLYSNASYGAVNSNATFGGVVANLIGLNNGTNVFASHPLQDRNLHNIESFIQPLYTAQEDLVDLHMAYNLTDSLTLTSITGYNRDTGTNAAGLHPHRADDAVPAFRHCGAAVPRRRDQRSPGRTDESAAQPGLRQRRVEGIHRGAAADVVVQGSAELLGRRLLFRDHRPGWQRHELLCHEQRLDRLLAAE